MSDFKFMWQPWANLQSWTAGIFLMMGGIIGLFYPKTYLIINSVNLALSVLIVAVEHKIVSIPGMTTNFYLWALILALATGAGMISAPSQPGAFCLACAVLTYIKAATNGEDGNPKPKK
ncbi:hypothetical protein BC833DRAFT_573665 [Globomyces pollinis-pini]|nr:hypothetical protein BC833DRAFT_573665 [Globomyces pollinis-pini]KAJ2993138.1 hypothetical protein HDV02_002616 [Globomyces sp. JEL0801]